MHRITVRNMEDFNTIYKKGISSSVLELHQSKSEIMLYACVENHE